MTREAGPSESAPPLPCFLFFDRGRQASPLRLSMGAQDTLPVLAQVRRYCLSMGSLRPFRRGEESQGPRAEPNESESESENETKRMRDVRLDLNLNLT